MMGAAMLKCRRFVWFLWGWPKCVRGGVRRSPCNKYNNTFTSTILLVLLQASGNVFLTDVNDKNLLIIRIKMLIYDLSSSY